MGILEFQRTSRCDIEGLKRTGMLVRACSSGRKKNILLFACVYSQIQHIGGLLNAS